MAIISQINLSDSNSLKQFINAAAPIISSYGGILIGGSPGKWEVVTQYPSEKPAKLDSADEAWVREVMSYGDVITLKDACEPCHNLKDIIGIIDIEKVIFISIKDSLGSLLGVVILLSNCAVGSLSKDNIYALQTHSLLIRHVLIQRCDTSPCTYLSALDRLRLLESAVIHAKDAILITEAEPIDQPGPRILYCNTAFLAATGFRTDEVVGQTPRILQCEETDRATLDTIRDSLRNWRPIEVELINKRKDGTHFWVQLSIVPVANEDGIFTHWVSIQRDITERKAAEATYRQAQIDREQQVSLASRLAERERMQDQLTYAAFHDDLTRLKNKAYFKTTLQQAFCDQSSTEASILYLDLDNFKYINDGMGHGAGDALLQGVARLLENCISGSACLARIGGDEFAILYSEEGHREMSIYTAQRVIQMLSEAFEVEDQLIFTSCSIGIATKDLSHTSAEDLIRDADVAMYAAKKKGRGQWAIFDSSMRQSAIDTLFMRNAIKHAMGRQEFYLVYQPVYSLLSLEITGVEALLRWSSPELGDIPPDTFIEVAEDVGIICDLGRWVMTKACEKIQVWNKALQTPLTLSVNISGTQLKQTGFVSSISELLSKTGLNPHYLQIEITESVFLNESQTVTAALADLREFGIRIALDDFGTGYSSLGYIDRYPIDAIKIDRSFINRMMTHQRTAAVIQSIFSLGSSLSTAIVAEGIETVEQLDRLRHLNCPYVQGYLLSPPLSEQEFEALFLKYALPNA